jgi:hypothetical protein
VKDLVLGGGLVTQKRAQEKHRNLEAERLEEEEESVTVISNQ